MAHYKLDTNMAGAFINLYQPIGDDPVVKSLEPDAVLFADKAYSLRACEYCRMTDNTHQFVTTDDMCQEVDKYLTNKNYYQNEYLRNGESREGESHV